MLVHMNIKYVYIHLSWDDSLNELKITIDDILQLGELVELFWIMHTGLHHMCFIRKHFSVFSLAEWHGHTVCGRLADAANCWLALQKYVTVFTRDSDRKQGQFIEFPCSPKKGRGGGTHPPPGYINQFTAVDYLTLNLTRQIKRS